MTYQIEFFRITEASPKGEVMGRCARNFDDIKSAAHYGICRTREKYGLAEADGFRIYADGVLANTVFIRVPKKQPDLR